MMTAAEAGRRFLWGLLAGAVLGVLYSFLRPLRRVRQAPADLLFLLGAGWAWVYLSFAICRGDPRPAYLLGAIAGGLVTELTLGLLLRPVFSIFWKITALPLKKISKIAKFTKYLQYITKFSYSINNKH